MSITEKTDHDAEALGQLLLQYQGATRLEGWISAYVAQIQELEGVIWDVGTSADPDQSFGAQLDLLGAIVGQAREGLSDAEYRRRIKVRILVNTSSGTAEELIRAVVFAAGVEASDVIYTEPGAAQAVVTVVPAVAMDTPVAHTIRSMKPAGVHYYTEWFVSESGTFTFSDTDATKTDAAKGFGDDGGGGTGGVLASAV